MTIGGTPTQQNPIAIKVDDLHVHYEVLMDSNEPFLGAAKNVFRHRVKLRVKALEGVSFQVHQGDVLGLVGHNGAGKTTLLQAVAGFLQPSRGSVLVSHQPQMLGVKAALNPRISGRLNVELGCLALGMTRAEIAVAGPDIMEFSDIGDFINLPVNTYSAGMRVRLAFAISTANKPEILLIDEALAVGDKEFRERSLNRLRKIRTSAGAVILASHSIREIGDSCNKVLWLHEGKVRLFGPADEVLTAYQKEKSLVNRSLGAEPRRKEAPQAPNSK
jgi:teichoic acid transport system ATP-binding protein